MIAVKLQMKEIMGELNAIALALKLKQTLNLYSNQSNPFRKQIILDRPIYLRESKVSIQTHLFWVRFISN